MKLSAGLAALSLLFAFAATVEASSAHDAAMCHPRTHHKGSGNTHKGPGSVNKGPGNVDKGSGNVDKGSGNTDKGSGNVHKGSGTIQPADHGRCNPVGATSQVTKLSGPNGHIDWLNCGVDGGGWSPAPVKLEELIAVSLESARHTAFAPCSDEVIATFIEYGKHHNVPAIVFASIAMQESGCNPDTVGGAGEQGLMQITPDKCKGAPNGNCKDIEFNIRTGAEYFVSVLEEDQGDILLTIGRYNGWKQGMTHADATRAAQTCCRCQNNLDYVHQFINGWCQGVNAYDKGLGKYHNLENCH